MDRAHHICIKKSHQQLLERRQRVELAPWRVARSRCRSGGGVQVELAQSRPRSSTGGHDDGCPALRPNIVERQIEVNKLTKRKHSRLGKRDGATISQQGVSHFKAPE
eukprot:scaffold274398_cov36-Tisochrysis_lutea.AAC.1